MKRTQFEVPTLLGSCDLAEEYVASITGATPRIFQSFDLGSAGKVFLPKNEFEAIGVDMVVGQPAGVALTVLASGPYEEDDGGLRLVGSGRFVQGETVVDGEDTIDTYGDYLTGLTLRFCCRRPL